MKKTPVRPGSGRTGVELSYYSCLSYIDLPGCGRYSTDRPTYLTYPRRAIYKHPSNMLSTLWPRRASQWPTRGDFHPIPSAPVTKTRSMVVCLYSIFSVPLSDEPNQSKLHENWHNSHYVLCAAKNDGLAEGSSSFLAQEIAPSICALLKKPWRGSCVGYF